MAVIKCAECGGQVSTSAKSCPGCGASPKKYKKSSSSLTTVLLWIVGIGIVASIFGGGERGVESAGARTVVTPEPAAAVQNISVAAPSVPASSICKAAIATIMGRPVSTISATDQAGEVVLSYVRSDDGSAWKYKCKLQGDRAVWAAEGGRWRIHPDDSVVRYTAGSSSLTITESYGGQVTASKQFSLSEF